LPSWRFQIKIVAAHKVNISRTVQPEILDALPQDSCEATSSRRDLRVINRLLGSTAWFRRVVRERVRSDDRVLEVGAGTGELGRAISLLGIRQAGLDLCRCPAVWPHGAPWFETDILDFREWDDYPIVIGNLFFHHFDRAALEQLGSSLNEHARVIVASEPLRGPRTRRLFNLVCPLIRAHPVTRYDGRVSIAAGFRHDELPHLLRLNPAVWSWRVQESWLGSYRLVAERHS